MGDSFSERPWHAKDLTEIKSARGGDHDVAKNWYGDREKALQPPVALLSWLIRNLDSAESRPLGTDETSVKRRKLMEKDPATIGEALDHLRRKGTSRAWHILEGATYPDVFIETPDALIVIEGKRTEAGATTHTTWMPNRHQMLRHIDAAWEIRGKRDVYGFFIVEGGSSTEAWSPQQCMDVCTATRSAEAINGSLPRRSPEEQKQIANCFRRSHHMAGRPRRIRPRYRYPARHNTPNRREREIDLMHPLIALRELIPPVPAAVTGVVAQHGVIAGTAFFPGGWGLWGTQPDKPLPPMPTGGIMIVGQDFDSAKNFQNSLARGFEVRVEDDGCSDDGRSVTWRALLALLHSSGIPLTDCFFTNAYMGLRASEGNTGRFPGSLHKDYKRSCQQFFLQQVATQEPRLIITLGTWVPQFLAPRAPELIPWRKARTFAQIDEAGALKSNVRFEGSTKACCVAALTHPSYRALNVRHRAFDGCAESQRRWRSSKRRCGYRRRLYANRTCDRTISRCGLPVLLNPLLNERPIVQKRQLT